jgi:alpha-beta hydrolase superfamily lysophospholipase
MYPQGSKVTTEFYTESGVRLRRHSQRPGELNWLLPGGPGIGSESLHELANALDVPGTVWTVDLPGDGSNVAPPGASADPFDGWPGDLIEAAQALPHSVFVGHSTGGMYLLSVPELEQHLAGLVLISSAPDASWHPAFIATTERHPLPEVEEATRRYEADPTDANLGEIAVASAPWNFTPGGVAAGRQFLGRCPKWATASGQCSGV